MGVCTTISCRTVRTLCNVQHAISLLVIIVHCKWNEAHVTNNNGWWEREERGEREGGREGRKEGRKKGRKEGNHLWTWVLKHSCPFTHKISQGVLQKIIVQFPFHFSPSLQLLKLTSVCNSVHKIHIPAFNEVRTLVCHANLNIMCLVPLLVEAQASKCGEGGARENFRGQKKCYFCHFYAEIVNF